MRAELAPAGTDYIDLYMIHFPDPATPVEETLGALTELVQAGKVREIGCSNYTAELLREAEAISLAPAPTGWLGDAIRPSFPD